jgi:hypothetical protein
LLPISSCAQSQRAIAAATADYSATLRRNQEERIAAVAAVQEAQVQIDLLAKEVESFGITKCGGAIAHIGHATRNQPTQPWPSR